MRRAIALAALCLGLGACAAPGQTDASPTPEAVFPITLTDDDGVNVTIEEEPQRIVTYAPANTEIAFALGLGERVVGVSGEFDDFPSEVRSIEHVGGAGEFGVDPNVETVVSLEPDLFLAGFPGEQPWKERLRDVGIPVFTVNAANFDDLVHDIQTVGRLTGAVDEATTLTSDMVDAEQAVEDRAADEGRVSCFFEVGFEGGFYTVGPGSFIFDLLERAGCDPVTADADEDYPQWSVEELVKDDPDVYLVSSESVGASPAEVAERPGFGQLSAVTDGRVAPIDSDLISRPGPRVVDGLEALFDALHGS